MGFGISRMVTFNVVRCLADNLEVSDYAILDFFIVEKIDFGYVFNIAMNPLNRYDNMFRIIGNTKGVFFTHSGCASFITWSRIYSRTSASQNKP